MKKQFCLCCLSILLLCFSQAHAQNWFNVFGPGFLIPDGGTANVYPAETTVSGVPPYISGIQVALPQINGSGSFSGLDLMLESPSGTKVMLFSDWEIPETVFQISGVSVAYDGVYVPTQGFLYNGYLHPSNFGSGPDDFPAPGPGLVYPSDPTFAPMMNENPNGTWRLWAVDDSLDNGGFDEVLISNWVLYLRSGPEPICIYPELLNIPMVTETTALLNWSDYGAADKWDIYYGKTLLNYPDDATIPTIAGWTNDTILLTGLEQQTDYTVFIRSVCDDGTPSEWAIQGFFQTLFNPCQHLTALEICKEVNCDTVPLLNQVFVGSTCGAGAPTWLFEFTPPETGAYWLQRNEWNIKAYLLPDTTANCPVDGWKCLTPDTTFSLVYSLDTLIGGVNYFLSLEAIQTNPPVFSISQCPLSALSLNPLNILTDSMTLVFGAFPALNLSDSIEVYFGLSPTPAPTDASLPSAGAWADASTSFLMLGNLVADTEYDIYLRRRCGPEQTSCWQGPFTQRTARLCSELEFFGVDTLTYSWAEISFTWETASASPESWGVRLCQPGDDPNLTWENDLYFNTNGADTLHVRMQNINSWQPLKLFLLANCNLPSQSWLGPFDFPAGNAPPVRIHDIYCGEPNHTIPDPDYHTFTLNGLNYEFVNTIEITNPGYQSHMSDAEKLFRYHASKDDTISLSWTGEGYTGFFDMGVGFFLKSDATVPGNQAWTYLGKWNFGTFDPASYPVLTFEVKKDSTYYILCDAFSPTGQGLGGAPFTISGCEVTCPAIDTIIKTASTATSITLTWNNAVPGGSYIVEYLSGDHFLEAPLFAETTDTTITLAGLDALAEYYFWVRTVCPAGDAGPEVSSIFQIGENPVFSLFQANRCNPHFFPPGATLPQLYEQLALEVPLAGEYVLKARFSQLYVYENGFDPANPSANLLASATAPLYAPNVISIFLQPGISYDVVLTSPEISTAVNGYDLPFSADGVAAATLGAAFWNMQQDHAHGHVPTYPADISHDLVCQDTSGWLHIYARGADLSDVNSDRLLLSIKDYEPIENFNTMHLLVSGTTGASLITNPPALFVQNPSGWYEMNRFWNIPDAMPDQEPDQPVNVRFYYTQQDFENIKTAIEAQGGSLATHEAMFFHKINGLNDFSQTAPWMGHPDVPAALTYDGIGYWQYANGPDATTLTWRLGDFAGEYFAEMVIRSFSGGGGGASVNGNPVFDTTNVSGVEVGRLPSKVKIMIFPNPTSGALTLEFKGATPYTATLQFLDLLGRTLRSEKILPGQQQHQISMDAIPAGVYFVKVLDGGEPIWVQKVVKQ